MPLPQDPDVVNVEDSLRSAVPDATVFKAGGERLVCKWAVFICACITEYDAPNWLIGLDSAGEVAWGRVPYDVKLDDAVVADVLVHGHAEPEYVARWLRGDDMDGIDWLEGGSLPKGVLARVLSRLRELAQVRTHDPIA